jgi:uncharacterized protein YbjT (DUF2867 family)
MRIIVFGATGATGKCLVPLLLKSGHQVTVFVRSPNKVDRSSGQVQIVQGDVRDVAVLTKALAGQDVAMSTFGSRSLSAGDIQEVFMKNLITAMHNTGVHRLIDLSALGAGDSSSQVNFFFKIVMATILKQMFADKNRGELLLVASDIDYTLVRPSRLTNGRAKGNVRASSSAKGLRRSISRQDVAAFMVSQLNDITWVRKAPIIGY